VQQFIGTKLVNAEPMNRADYNILRSWELPADEDGTDEGYLVEYVDGGKANLKGYDGYISWSPKDVFKNANNASGNMSFGDALVILKSGARVARAGWNGKDQFVYMISGPALQTALGYGFGEYENEPSIQSALAIKTTSNQIQIGWLASQSDMLSSDWCVV
jgi:hypothetical protein